jgi:hypothetical protein
MNTPIIESCSRALKLGPGINPISTQLPTTRLSVFSSEGNLLSGVAKSVITGIKKSLCVDAVQGEKREEWRKLHTKPELVILMWE